MRFTKKKLSEYTDMVKKLINSPLKKALITTVAIAAAAFHTNPVVFANDTKPSSASNSSTYFGAVPAANKTAKVSPDQLDNYKTAILQLSSNLQNIPVQVFRTRAENEQSIQSTASAPELKVKSAAVVINGKPVVYVDNKSAAHNVIRKLKLQYVTEDQLKEFEAGTAASQSLAQNESRILDLHLSADVSVKEETSAPDQVLSEDQAVNFLQQGTLEESKYKVKAGDVLGRIANEHQLKIADLIPLNPGLTENSVLQIDQELNVTVPKPFVEVMVAKEINQQEEIAYQTEVKEDPNMASGDSQVSQQGQAGLQDVTYDITEQNGTVIKKDVINQDVIKQPINQIIIKGTKAVPSHGEGTFSWPAVGGYISSTMGYRWGKLHKGIDIARPSNPTIKAADNGVVVSAGWDNGGYGNKIVINHQNGFQTVYAHLSSIGVKVGQNVEKGSPIGVMGATGDATGVHLHFEVYKNGALQDPLNYVSK